MNTKCPRYEQRIGSCLKYNMPWDNFRSNMCHMLKYYGDFEFLKILIYYDFVGVLWRKTWYAKAFYSLAILDYLTDKFGIENFPNYEVLRKYQLPNMFFPKDIEFLEALGVQAKDKAIMDCSTDSIGKYFFKYNIIEKDLYNVY